ncbi:MAG: hypothetical protein OCD01_03065 [Fibrobacterales bacterium]
MNLIKSISAVALICNVSLFAEEFTFEASSANATSTTEETSLVSETAAVSDPLYTTSTSTSGALGSLPVLYGTAFAVAMSGNPAVSTSTEDFMIFPHWAHGKSLGMIGPDVGGTPKGMLSMDALGGTMFGRFDGPTFALAFSPSSSIGGGLIFSFNTQNSLRKSESDATTKDMVNETFGAFASMGIGDMSLYAKVLHTDIKDSLLEENETGGNRDDIVITLGALITMGKITLDAGIDYTNQTDETFAIDLADTEKTVTTTGENDASMYSIHGNLGYTLKNRDDLKVYLGSNNTIIYHSDTDIEGSSKDSYSLSLGITPNAGMEYLLSQYFSVFGSVSHKINYGRDYTQELAGETNGDEITNSSLISNPALALAGLRFAYGNFSLESVITSDLTKLVYASAIITF